MKEPCFRRKKEEERNLLARLFHLRYNRVNSVPYPIRRRIGCFSMLYISDLSVFQNLIFSTFEVRSV